MGKAVSPKQSLPRVGKVASGASRIGQERCEKERVRSSQVRRLREHPIHRWRGPPSLMGKAKRRRLRRKKESQPRLAVLGSPFQGKGLARTLPVSSFRAKARNLFRSRSSRRCGESGISAPKPSPRGEGAPKGRIGQKRYEKERRRPSQVRRLRQYPIHRWRGPPSPMGKAKRRRLRCKKESQPRLAALGSPFQGKGLAWTLPVSSFRAKARNLFSFSVKQKMWG